MSRKITVENSWVEGAPAYALDEKRGWLRVRVASVAGDKVNVKDGKRKFTVKAKDLQLSFEKALKVRRSFRLQLSHA